jgi:hypothetical protein
MECASIESDAFQPAASALHVAETTARNSSKSSVPAALAVDGETVRYARRNRRGVHCCGSAASLRLGARA